MIDTEAAGQKKLDELLRQIEFFEWTDWEQEFLYTVQRRMHYKLLSSKQQGTVGRLYDKLLGGGWK